MLEVYSGIWLCQKVQGIYALLPNLKTLFSHKNIFWWFVYSVELASEAPHSGCTSNTSWLLCSVLKQIYKFCRIRNQSTRTWPWVCMLLAPPTKTSSPIGLSRSLLTGTTISLNETRLGLLDAQLECLIVLPGKSTRVLSFMTALLREKKTLKAFEIAYMCMCISDRIHDSLRFQLDSQCSRRVGSSFSLF